MNPKILHYCWFGNKEKPKHFSACLESWKQFCPDFEIREWNDSNTRKYQNKFYHDAYRKRKYAFMSDCIRAQVLNDHGGIYLDTDMMILKPIDSLLNHRFVIGEEVPGRINFALFGAVPGHRFLKKMIDFYSSTEFNEFSLPVITHTFKSLINRENLEMNEMIFPQDHFYPLSYENRNEDYRKFLTPNSYAVHLWEHSWSVEKKPGPWLLIRNINSVLIDYVFYGYSKEYLIRYVRGFSRQLYHYFFRKGHR